MGVFQSLDRAAAAAESLSFDDNDRIILFSDSHRGDNSWADDFAHNQNLMDYALQFYYENGYTCIEIGDGDELFENAKFSSIRNAHSQTFSALQKFHLEGRLYLIYGNHDITRRNPRVVERDFHEPIESLQGVWEPLFPGIRVHEAIRLKHEPSGGSFLLVHGHQGDILNDTFWPLGLIVTRYIWRNLQLIGAHNPISPAQSVLKQKRVEKRLIAWAQERAQPIICGHTHRPRLPNPGGAQYFNTGSSVFPHSITGIELAEGMIRLIQWIVRPDYERNGVLRIVRRHLGGQHAISDYMDSISSGGSACEDFVPIEGEVL